MRRTAITRGVVFAAIVAAVLAFGSTPAWASYTEQIVGTTLQITGNGASDKLSLRLQGTVPTVLEVDVGDNGTADASFDRSLFTGISVSAGGGNDRVRIDQSNGTFTDEAITIDGGAGNDTLLGGSGNEVFLGGTGDDFVDGNLGDDVAFLGEDDDTFHWDPGDGSDIVEGQSGEDVLDFNGSNVNERIEISANGGRVLFTRDVGNIVMDLNDVEGIAVHAFGGTDTVTVDDLTGTDVQEVHAELAAQGGGGDAAVDTVVVNGTAGADAAAVSMVRGTPVVSGSTATVTVDGAESANDALQLNGGAGNDTTTVNAGISGLAAVDVDGGADTDSTVIEGTKKADTISVVPNVTAATVLSGSSSPVNSTAEGLEIRGEGGSDILVGSVGLAAITSLTLDGGTGNDTLRGGNGDDRLVGGPGSDFVDGNQGNDVALMSEGNDTFHWDPGDASDIVEGQSGDDVLDFNGSNVNEQVEVSANGGRVRFTRDVANIVMDLDGVEGVVFHAFGGTDTFTVDDLTGTDAETVDADLAAQAGGTAGDTAADTVVVNGTAGADKVKLSRSNGKIQVAGLHAKIGIANAEPATDTLRVQTQAGDDTISVASVVFGLIQLLVDLGPDG
jgi:Ca2+-binding RTX toxin-like protein